MQINPIIPIWLMAAICLVLILLKRKGTFPYVRQIILVILIFLINLRIMVPDKSIEGQEKNLDAYVVFVIDDTISMLARDYNGDTERLTGVKDDCEYIINKLYGAKFSIISFNNSAQMLTPFANDSQFAINTIDSIYPLSDLYARGSSMNICKDIMVSVLKNAAKKEDGNVILFFISDGEITNDDKLESFSAAKDYIDYGAVLGYGTNKGAKMYLQSYFDDEENVILDNDTFDAAISKIDEGNLKKMAKDMGVGYINMNNKDGLDKILDKINNQSEKSSEKTHTQGYAETYYIFAIPALIILIIEFILYKRKGILV